MTTCHYCLDKMAAKTAKQLAVRRRNMALVPGASVHPCPQCHGVEWATTAYMIEPEPPPTSSQLLRFWNKLRGK